MAQFPTATKHPGTILNMAGEAVLADRAKTEQPTRKVDPLRIRPRGDQVLVRRLQKAEVTKGGIILPLAFENDFFHAEVLAVGPGHWDGGVLCPIDLKPGDIILVDEERKMPDGIMRKHLIPVTPDEKNVCLMLEGYARAVILPEADHSEPPACWDSNDASHLALCPACSAYHTHCMNR